MSRICCLLKLSQHLHLANFKSHLLAQKRDFFIFLEVRTIELIRDKEPSDWQGHFFIFLLFLKEFQVL